MTPRTSPQDARAELGRIIHTWVMFCFHSPGLVAAYDQLRGTNVAGKGSVLEQQIDGATGRRDADLQGFVEFCVDLLQRLPPEGIDAIKAMASR